MKKVYVLTAEQHDHSGFSVVRAYDETSKVIAESDLAMLQKHSDKKFVLHTVEMIEGA
jgi:hypothetical protein